MKPSCLSIVVPLTNLTNRQSIYSPALRERTLSSFSILAKLSNLKIMQPQKTAMVVRLLCSIRLTNARIIGRNFVCKRRFAPKQVSASVTSYLVWCQHIVARNCQILNCRTTRGKKMSCAKSGNLGRRWLSLLHLTHLLVNF